MFQSLTGRLQTLIAASSSNDSHCFNPSQVGYKRILGGSRGIIEDGFNPSQVGYKLMAKRAFKAAEIVFQSLTGRLQTHFVPPIV